MVDPKRVELTPFNSISHLATPVMIDTNKALTTLLWLNQEMDKRYQQLAQEHKHISTSYLQRRLHIGYPRAARLMEQLEEESGKGEEG